jgi:hypothetical protein
MDDLERIRKLSGIVTESDSGDVYDADPYEVVMEYDKLLSNIFAHMNRIGGIDDNGEMADFRHDWWDLQRKYGIKRMF